MDVAIGDLTRSGLQIHEGSLTQKVHRIGRHKAAPHTKDEPNEP